MKKIIPLFLSALMLLAVSCNNNGASETTLSINPAVLTMKVGEMQTIEATGSNIVWTSSNEAVATVYYGVVTAVAIGYAEITATSGSTSQTCLVYVSGSNGATLRISPAAVNLSKGETAQLSAGSSYNLDLTWSSSDENIATVDQTGLVTAHKSGNAYITLSDGLQQVQTLVAVKHVWGDYQLVWSDEFEGNSLDESVWTIQTGAGGWGNQEAQYYTARQENLRIEDGMLIIQPRKEDYDNSSYTSARIMSKNKKDFTYGKMEARIKLPVGGGLWPAFWMLGYGNWPNCGEIDIMEYTGNYKGRVLGTLHTLKDRSGSRSSRAYYLDGIENDFHIFGVEWTQEEDFGKDVIRFYVDNDVYSTQTESEIDNNEYWPFNKPEFFIINCAIGGTLGGSINDNIWANNPVMKVDWVRVYQRQEIE